MWSYTGTGIESWKSKMQKKKHRKSSENLLKIIVMGLPLENLENILHPPPEISLT